MRKAHFATTPMFQLILDGIRNEVGCGLNKYVVGSKVMSSYRHLQILLSAQNHDLDRWLFVDQG